MQPLAARRLVALALVALLPACPDLIAGQTDSAGDTAGSTGAPDPTTSTTQPVDPTTGFELLCTPGQTRCDPGQAGVLETCKDTGTAWDKTPCAHECLDNVDSASCVGPCDKLTDPTSIGCEFLALRMASHNGDDFSDALIVGNTDPTEIAAVQLYFTPKNDLDEQPIADPVILAPGESHVFDIAAEPLYYSNFRNGGVFRLVSDRPVAAYLHSPLVNVASNDASMLLPVKSLRKDYVVASWPAFVNPAKPEENGRPSYFTVIALEGDTHVQWTPKRTTAKQGELIDEIGPGETGTRTMQRFDVLQIAASSPDGDTDYVLHDVSGTVVSADKPIWVMGATQCAFVPFDSGWCNHLQEQMIPLEYWGTTYIGPPSPPRADEMQYWRVYAGEDNVQVTVDDNDPQTSQQSVYLAKRGDFELIEREFGVSILFTGLNDAPILPVQYLAGNKAAGGIGDPAMVQAIPVEQWRDRYVFVTGAAYDINYAQVIRRTGAADVTLNGQVVGGYQLVNFKAGHNYEVANVQLPGGDEALSYVASSSDPFSVIVVGYNPAGVSNMNTSAYAYPGGMRLQKIYQP